MTYTVKVTWPAGATERPVPATTSNGLNILPSGATVIASEIVADRDNPDNKSKRWAHLIDGKFIAVDYPNNQGPQVRATVTDDAGSTPLPPSPIPTTAAITAHVELNDGIHVYAGDVQLNQK
jgi:hypothetical protein